MPVEAAEFKRALSRFATGVTVVTVTVGDEMHGMTASAFASVSLEPPRILVCLDKTSRTRALVRDSDTFAVSILAADQEAISRAFAHTGPKPFDGLSRKHAAGGAPLLDGALAWLECERVEVVDGGDHDIVIGEVTSCANGDGDPLIYFDRTYRALHER